MYTDAEDFRLLVKLSYTNSYIRNGGKRLDKSTLVRLASMANAYEFRDAVKECMIAIGDDLEFEDAITCIDYLPENLRGLDLTQSLANKAIAVLKRGLEDPDWIRSDNSNKPELLKKGTEALAKFLGPVQDLFRPQGGCLGRPTRPDFYEALILYDHVKVRKKDYSSFCFLVSDIPQVMHALTSLCHPSLLSFYHLFFSQNLSESVFTALLESDALQVQCENEVYYLLHAYVHQSSRVKVVDKKKTFQRLLLSYIRFPHLTSDYLGNVISWAPFLAKSDIIARALAESWSWRLSDSIRDADNTIPQMPIDRSKGQSREWKVKVEIRLHHLLEMTRNSPKYYGCGLVLGYPLLLAVSRNGSAEEGEEKDTFALWWKLIMPPASSSVDRRVRLGFSIKADSGEWVTANNGFGKEGRVLISDDYFKKSWKEVVCEGSPYFPKGVLEVEAKIGDTSSPRFSLKGRWQST